MNIRLEVAEEIRNPGVETAVAAPTRGNAAATKRFQLLPQRFWNVDVPHRV